MKCQNCGGKAKLYQISAKCSDQYSHQHLGGNEHDGYVPDWIGEYGDYVSFTICRHCGQVQGAWPHTDESLGPYKYGKAAN
jgi:hypothetical protein